ncbi:hypothetical protein RYX36_031062 [Vicia faba]
MNLTSSISPFQAPFQAISDQPNNCHELNKLHISSNSSTVDGFLQTIERNPGDFVGTSRSGTLLASVVSFSFLLEKEYVFVCIFLLLTR